MCEILLRVKHSAPATDRHHMGRTQAGDVIVVMPDGWSWGRKEVESGEWRILQLPDTQHGDVADMLVDGPTTSRNVKSRRAKFFDLESLPWLRDSMATAHAIRLTTGEQSKLLKSKRVRSQDYTVIGG